MSKLFSYSFSMTPPAASKPSLQDFDYNEFLLALPSTWQQVPTAEHNTFNFKSTELEAGITISADF